jgi:hypothetical protein
LDYTTKEPDCNPVIPAGKTVCWFLYPENRQSGFALRSAWGGQKAGKQVDENFTESREKNFCEPAGLPGRDFSSPSIRGGEVEN